jgi:hypothetical protein
MQCWAWEILVILNLILLQNDYISGLLQLGAQSLIPLGLGDDQHDLGYDAAADPWIDSLWTNLLLIHPLPNGVQPLEKNFTITPR